MWTASAAGAQSVDDSARRESLVYFRAGQELMSAEQFGRAAEEFVKAIDRNPLFALAHYQLGRPT